MTEGLMNLSVPRGDKSVWDEPRGRLSGADHERWVAAASGSALAMIGARRGGFAGGLIAMAGSVLAVRAAIGRHDLGTARDWIDSTLKDRGWRRRDIVHEASEESFPASDSPALSVIE